jgi:small neutral amino acid transporter SnatA (MarC family)
MRHCSQETTGLNARQGLRETKHHLLLGDTTMSALANTFSKFHSDEEGLEALQVVMIIAIAAVILVAAASVADKVVKFTGTKLDTLNGTNVKGVS